jgi:hypothetical protein
MSTLFMVMVHPVSDIHGSVGSILQDSVMQKMADWTLAVAIPVHMQITTNALVTDYVATKFRGEAVSGCGSVSHFDMLLMWHMWLQQLVHKHVKCLHDYMEHGPRLSAAQLRKALMQHSTNASVRFVPMYRCHLATFSQTW